MSLTTNQTTLICATISATATVMAPLVAATIEMLKEKASGFDLAIAKYLCNPLIKSIFDREPWKNQAPKAVAL